MYFILESGSCDAGWRSFMSHCYFVNTGTRSWEDSRNDCRVQMADLVVIETKEEQNFLTGIAIYRK